MRLVRYKKEKKILALSWIVTCILLLVFIPRKKIREAHLSFLFKQIITWIFGLIVVEKGLIKYPVRIFKKANKASFTFEYFVYPALCAIFNVNYPEKRNSFIKCLYYLFHTGLIVVFEIYAVKYTNLIKYPKWRWYWSFITIWVTYYVSRLYYRWYFQKA
ncbi:CBO0543 family protein [Evansella sp. AB-P1]|uniref:CBO0543 family protein n=1 Tax=Evansella sp. AB-P1 TaxID=3037653 RepID=UPI00325B8AB2